MVKNTLDLLTFMFIISAEHKHWNAVFKAAANYMQSVLFCGLYSKQAAFLDKEYLQQRSQPSAWGEY